MTFLPSDPTRQHGEGHITALIAGMLLGTTTPTAADMERAATHALGCHDCQVVLAVLAATVATTGDISVREHAGIERLLDQLAQALNEHTFAGDAERYSAFAETVVRRGESAARQRYPLVARHLDRCARCAADTNELIQDLRGAVAAGIISFPASVPERAAERVAEGAHAAAEAAAPESIWRRESQRVQRLREKLAIIVGQATITVMSALPELRPQALPAAGIITSPELGAAREAGTPRGPDATMSKEERLVFTIRPGALPPAHTEDAGIPWLRIALHLSARQNQVVLLGLTTEVIVTGAGDHPPDAEATGRPWPGISWRIEYPTGEVRLVIAAGATDARGKAACDLMRVGDHELVMSDGVETWLIPFEVHRRQEAGSSQEAAGRQPGP